jgi:hypothetical protein
VHDGACEETEGLKQCARSCCEAGQWTGLTDALPAGHKQRITQYDDYEKSKAQLTSPKVTVSAEQFKQSVDDMAAHALSEAESEVAKVTTQLEQVRAAAMQHVKRVADVYAKHMPKLKSITVDRIYLQCIYRPEVCNTQLVKRPEITVCFTSLGCLSSKTSKLKPTAATMQMWINKETQKLTLKWFESMLKYEHRDILMPHGVEYVFQPITITGQGEHEVEVLTGGVETKPRTIRYPVGVHEEALRAFESAAAQPGAGSGAHVDTDHILPEPFTEEGEEEEALKDLKNDDAANTMHVGVATRMPPNMDQAANKEIEHDVETHAAGEYHTHEHDPTPMNASLPPAEEAAFTKSGEHPASATEVETHTQVKPAVDKEQSVHAIFSQLVVLVKTDTKRACAIAQSLIKKLGLSTFKTLSGIHGMNCADPSKPAMSHRAYETLKANVEQMSQVEKDAAPHDPDDGKYVPQDPDSKSTPLKKYVPLDPNGQPLTAKVLQETGTVDDTVPEEDLDLEF